MDSEPSEINLQVLNFISDCFHFQLPLEEFKWLNVRAVYFSFTIMIVYFEHGRETGVNGQF